MDARLAPLAGIFRLNTRLVHNCVAELTPPQFAGRAAPDVNSAAFLVAHLTDSRHHLLRVVGGDAENPVAPYVDGARSMAEVKELPAPPLLMAGWDAVARALLDQLAALDAAALDAPAPQRMPGADPTILGTIGFLAQHDSYHLGQLAFVRRLYGLPAMRYER